MGQGRLLEGGFYELGRNLRDDGVAGGAQLSHSGGYPMSQREKAGFSWPPLSVPAGEPEGIGPAIATVVCKLIPPEFSRS